METGRPYPRGFLSYVVSIFCMSVSPFFELWSKKVRWYKIIIFEMPNFGLYIMVIGHTVYYGKNIWDTDFFEVCSLYISMSVYHLDIFSCVASKFLSLFALTFVYNAELRVSVTVKIMLIIGQVEKTHAVYKFKFFVCYSRTLSSLPLLNYFYLLIYTHFTQMHNCNFF